MSNSFDELRKKNQQRAYAHFGRRGSMKDAWIWEYIIDPAKVKKHNFYPFISYEKNYTKYDGKEQNPQDRKKEKYRELCYSTHLDRCIYQYYGAILNEMYNQRVLKDDINDTSIAYRNNLHKSNIHFAKEAIDFIRSMKQCYIIVGDFKSFFDSLDHLYLKHQLCNLMETDRLPDDYYAIYKNITKYAMCRLEDILEFFGKENNHRNKKELNSKHKIMSDEDFKTFKGMSFANKRRGLKETNKHRAVAKNESHQGIPQGSAISAVFANIYMLDFDKNVYEYVKSYQGLYMRYSDDFIIILPGSDDGIFREQYQTIRSEIDKIPSLVLESKKTQVYQYSAGGMLNCNETFIPGGIAGKDALDYLGFIFDGKQVALRDKTVSKYYYRMYHKAKAVRRWAKKSGRVQAKSLYNLYSSHRNQGPVTDKDKRKHKHGNFLSYVLRAQGLFGRDEPISRSTRNHMLKIKRIIKPKKK